MAVLKGQGLMRFVEKPDPAYPIILVYGPDSGLVSERANRIARQSVPDLDDPFAVVRLEGTTLLSDPARLSDEAGTVALFGGRRLIWIKAQELAIAPAVDAVLARPVEATTILIEAGDLKRTAPLRTAAEKSDRCAVLPCYADGEADVVRLIADEVAAAGLRIDQDAAAWLASLLGGDRAASRAEIRKLCLYAHGQTTITLADIEAVAGDSAMVGADRLVDAAAGGDPETLDRLTARAEAADLGSTAIMIALGRHLMSLHKASLHVARGVPAADAARRFEPPVFFRRQDLVERQLRLWTPERLERMIVRVAEATLDTRMRGAMANAITARTLMAVALAAKAGGRRGD